MQIRYNDIKKLKKEKEKKGPIYIIVCNQKERLVNGFCKFKRT
jgi:hypothetical protein